MTSELSFDLELVNRLPKIQAEAEFSELMTEHFVGFPPSGGTRNYAHGGQTTRPRDHVAEKVDSYSYKKDSAFLKLRFF